VGDIITLDTDEGSPVPVLVEGRTKLLGQPRVSGGSHAIVLDDGLQPLKESPHSKPQAA
jgi:flagellar motor switch protein FliM